MIYYSNENLTIRDIKETDAALMEKIPEEEKGDASEYRIDWYYKETQEGKHSTIIAEIEGAVAGYINVCPEQTSYYEKRGDKEGTFFYDFYILEKYRGKGIGSILLTEAERIAKPFGRSVWLTVEIDNAKAIEYYEKRGYKRADNLLYELNKEYTSIEEFKSLNPNKSTEWLVFRYYKEI